MGDVGAGDVQLVPGDARPRRRGCARTRTYSSTVAPATLTITAHRHCANRGAYSRATCSTPGVLQADAVEHPAGRLGDARRCVAGARRAGGALGVQGADAVEVDELGELEAEPGGAAGEARPGWRGAGRGRGRRVRSTRHATCAGGSCISSSHATAADRHHRPVAAAERPPRLAALARARAARSRGRCRSRTPSAPPATPPRAAAASTPLEQRARQRGEHRVGPARVHRGVARRGRRGCPSVTRPAAAAAAVDGQLDDRDAARRRGRSAPPGRAAPRVAAPLTTVTSAPRRAQRADQQREGRAAEAAG